MVQAGALGPFRHVERRGARRDQGQCRPDAGLDQPGDPAPARHRRQVRRRPRPDGRLGLPDRQAYRQLRRELRTHGRQPLGAEDVARPERALDQGGLAVRAADPVRFWRRRRRRIGAVVLSGRVGKEEAAGGDWPGAC
ncbi:hypothetical protein BOS5A_200520 [Bosea sp. EC-HK365B]|nr:hypothetical protein BOSE21B_110465 [Bosea sp. 21B]CAD5279969.1 hypothetical protein BOSE7B_40749 [Bosea sp. 7B]VVT58307.1 hypothetical protein BOS5A_200520 [Bosea sp. EC-HK365B]VXC83941.1 hypothetical protein BOSE127_60148 [Bosea sp. 127]